MNQSKIQMDSEIHPNGFNYIPLKEIRETCQKPDYRTKGIFWPENGPGRRRFMGPGWLFDWAYQRTQSPLLQP